MARTHQVAIGQLLLRVRRCGHMVRRAQGRRRRRGGIAVLLHRRERQTAIRSRHGRDRHRIMAGMVLLLLHPMKGGRLLLLLRRLLLLLHLHQRQQRVLIEMARIPHVNQLLLRQTQQFQQAGIVGNMELLLDIARRLHLRSDGLDGRGRPEIRAGEGIRAAGRGPAAQRLTGRLTRLGLGENQGPRGNWLRM